MNLNLRTFIPSSCRFKRLAPTVLLLCLMPAAASAQITGEEASRFVRAYLEAAQQATPDAEVDVFADRVRYFDDGTVGREYIAQDQRRYYQRWPQRFFELVDEPVITENQGDTATLKFTIRYEVSGPGRHASGATENTMRVQRFGDALKIVAMSERKVNARDLPRQASPSQVENSTATNAPTNPSRAPARSPSTESAGVAAASSGKRESLKPNAKVGKSGESRPEAKAGPQKATPVPGSPGFVYPPGVAHTPENVLDVRGYSYGQKVKDPRTGQVFIVP